MNYSRKFAHAAAVVIAICSVAATASPSFSANSAHHVRGKKTDYGDGIKMFEAADQSGFVITTDDGTSLSFTAKNQQVVFTQKNGARKVITFSTPSTQDIAKTETPLIVDAH